MQQNLKPTDVTTIQSILKWPDHIKEALLSKLLEDKEFRDWKKQKAPAPFLSSISVHMPDPDTLPEEAYAHFHNIIEQNLKAK